MTEAEAAWEPVFLAVHQPMRLSRRRLSGQGNRDPEEKKEADLLEALLVKNPPSGTLLVPIVGSSGVGKSHMIRWIDAHLQRREDGVARRVVRIPKSASLRMVLQLILRDLSGRKYDALRKEVLSARLMPNLLEATHGLREKLLVALERENRAASARVATGKARLDDKERLAHLNQRNLPALLEDPELKPHFMRVEGEPKGVLARIAERAVQGAAAADGPANQFTEEDLVFDDELDLSSLSASARLYLKTLGLRDGHGRRTAVAVLNDVIDRALGELLDFGGNSLTDLFVRMREQLLEDDLELVLLVEDFAALAGIQGSLLDAMIREGKRSGKQELCVMRTALAVTEGYLANRETVLTRAQYEWRIEDRPFASENEAIETFCNFVGGYLNAARWGKARLEAEFSGRSPDQHDLDQWIPNFYDHRHEDLDEASRRTIETFGFSARGNHPLFPFNEEAIRQVARRHLLKGAAFIFNPRDLLNIVLRETLLDGRPLFEANCFPSSDWQRFSRSMLDARVSGELSRRAPAEHADRLACLIFHWGDAPESPAEAAALPENIYNAFDLPPLTKWSEAPSERSKDRPLQKGPRTGGETGESPKPPPDPWEAKLQRWRSDGVITSTDANKIREYLRDELKEWVDWEALMIKATKLDHTLIALPKVSMGNPSATNTMTTAAADLELGDSASSDRFFVGVRALINFQSHKRSWNYAGGEMDAVAYAILVEPMVCATEEWLRRQAHEVPRAALRPLAQALLIGARILNLDGASSNSDAANLAAIFADTAPGGGSTTYSPDQWSRLRESALSARSEMKGLLLQFVAARQGAGETVQAIDAAELLEAVRELRKSWTLAVDLDLKLFARYTSVQEHIRQLHGQLKSAVQQRGEALSRWRGKVTICLGEDFELRTVIEELRATVRLAQKCEVYRAPGITPDYLCEQIGKLQGHRIKETLELARRATESTDFGVTLSAVAQADDRTEEASGHILKQYEQFLDNTAAETEERLETAPPSVAEESERRVADVAAIEELWKEVEVAK